MDPTKLLEADHRQVEDLFERIDQASGEQRLPLIRELESALTAHMQLEEAVVYPAIKPIVGEEEITEGDTEHELARKSLAEMVKLAPDQPGFGAALEATKAGIQHHVEEEEGEVFPKVRSDGQSVLDEITVPFMRKRQALGLPVDGETLAAASTKEQLLEEARSAGIDHTSSMSKEELANALADTLRSS
jgi:hemerythrin superfamily protein